MFFEKKTEKRKSDDDGKTSAKKSKKGGEYLWMRRWNSSDGEDTDEMAEEEVKSILNKAKAKANKAKVSVWRTRLNMIQTEDSGEETDIMSEGERQRHYKRAILGQKDNNNKKVRRM